MIIICQHLGNDRIKLHLWSQTQYWGKGLNMPKKVASPFFLKERRLRVKPIGANPASWLLLLCFSVIELRSYGEEDLIANIIYCQVHFPGILLIIFFWVLPLVSFSSHQINSRSKLSLSHSNACKNDNWNWSEIHGWSLTTNLHPLIIWFLCCFLGFFATYIWLEIPFLKPL